jgi:hypothetical protein
MGKAHVDDKIELYKNLFSVFRFFSCFKRYSGALQGRVLSCTKVKVLAIVPRFQDFWEVVENNA